MAVTLYTFPKRSNRLIAPPQGFTVPCMEATHGFFLGRQKKLVNKTLQGQKELHCSPKKSHQINNKNFRSLWSKFLWPWGWSNFQCATLGSCDSCCVHCPPHSPRPKDLSRPRNCDTCGSNWNPIITFLGGLKLWHQGHSSKFQTPRPAFLGHSSYDTTPKPTNPRCHRHKRCLIPDPWSIEERISKNIAVALKTPRQRLAGEISTLKPAAQLRL